MFRVLLVQKYLVIKCTKINCTVLSVGPFKNYAKWGELGVGVSLFFHSKWSPLPPYYEYTNLDFIKVTRKYKVYLAIIKNQLL